MTVSDNENELKHKLIKISQAPVASLILIKYQGWIQINGAMHTTIDFWTKSMTVSFFFPCDAVLVCCFQHELSFLLGYASKLQWKIVGTFCASSHSLRLQWKKCSHCHCHFIINYMQNNYILGCVLREKNPAKITLTL